MTCKQLGGACDTVFQAETFDEIAEQSKQHGMKMYQQEDAVHMEAMKKMQVLMQSPDALQKWFAERKAEFEALPPE